MNDFEKRLSALLTEQVDHETGPRRVAPPFDRRVAARRRSPWVTPLLAAACVAAVVAGGFGVSSLVADHETPPVGPTHPPSLVHNPTATPTHLRTSPTTAATPSHTAGTTHEAPPAKAATHSASTPAPAGHPVSVAGATLFLPAGWTVGGRQKVASGGRTFGYDQYCISERSRPEIGCVLQLTRIRPPDISPDGNYQNFDVDALEFGVGDSAEYLCRNGVDPASPDEQAADEKLGGLDADYRYWRRTCGDGREWQEAQYVAASAGWGLSITDPPPALAKHYFSVFHSIAEQSSFPAPATALRYMDRGYLRSIEHTANGVRVTLDRVWRLDRGSAEHMVNDNPRTYTYLVPDRLFSPMFETIGRRVYVATDGSTVLCFHEEYT